jgi:hypothetical protein
MEEIFKAIADIDSLPKPDGYNIPEDWDDKVAQILELEQTIKALKEVVLKDIENMFEDLDESVTEVEGSKVRYLRTSRRTKVIGDASIVSEEFLESKLNTKEVNKYVKETGELPAGVEENVTVSYRPSLK